MFISQKSRNFAHVIELERHIEILLLNNDCVIVPDLGGFMTHHIDARYDEEDFSFLPPLRTLGFNPQIKINDSLLAQSYVEAYDISYPEALQRIEDEVNELKMHLQNEGSYELNDIGVLALNEEGHYTFTPCEAGILTPTLYGLGSFEMKYRVLTQLVPTVDEGESHDTQSAQQDDSAKIIGISQDTYSEKGDEDDDVVKIKFMWIRNTVAIAAILLAIFVLALPTGKTEMMTRTISNINNSLLFGMMSKDTNTSKIEMTKVDEYQPILAVDTILKNDTVSHQQASVESAERKGYSIVLASYVTRRNAKAFVEDLRHKGYDKAEVYIHNDVTRVIYGNFETQSEAYDTLRKIHRNKDLEEAWVYKFN